MTAHKSTANLIINLWAAAAPEWLHFWEIKPKINIKQWIFLRKLKLNAILNNKICENYKTCFKGTRYLLRQSLSYIVFYQINGFLAHLTKAPGINLYVFHVSLFVLWTCIHEYKLKLKYNVIVKQEGKYLIRIKAV